MLQAITRTLGQIADIPFVSSDYQLHLELVSEIMGTSFIQKEIRHGQLSLLAHRARGTKRHTPPPVSRRGYNLSLRPLTFPPPALRYQRPTTPGPGVVRALPLLPAPNPREDVSLQVTTQPGPHRGIGEVSVGVRPRGRRQVLTLSYRLLWEARMEEHPLRVLESHPTPF